MTEGRGINICIDCKRAYGDCPWSARYEPVPGWTATPTRRRSTAGDKRVIIESYKITACPLFEEG